MTRTEKFVHCVCEEEYNFIVGGLLNQVYDGDEADEAVDYLSDIEVLLDTIACEVKTRLTRTKYGRFAGNKFIMDTLKHIVIHDEDMRDYLTFNQKIWLVS